MRDSDAVDGGLETEFGAVVSVDVIGLAADGRARVQPVAASAGYLNQGEYVLHFALPADPDPRADGDVHFALSVDFKGVAEQGFPRVDRHVNPVLGDIDLAELELAGDREIVVYRSGRVLLAGCDFAPALPASALTTTTGGLMVPGATTPVPAPTLSPSTDWYVGIELMTDPLAAPQRVEELLVDGTFGAAIDCGGTLLNFAAWDVSDPSTPTAVKGSSNVGVTPARNYRSSVAVDWTFEPGRIYRIVARVTKLRGTPVVAPVTNGAFATTGGLSFQDLSPCDGIAVAAAMVDPTFVYLAARFRAEPGGAWADLGHGFAASGTAPTLVCSGELRADTDVTIDLAGAPVSSTLLLVAGVSPLCLPFADGVLVPAVDVLLVGTTDANGAAQHVESWPGDLPGGQSFHVQMLVLDPAAPHHFAFSNAVRATVPY